MKTQPGRGGGAREGINGLLIFRISEMKGDKVRRWRERKMEKGKERRAKWGFIRASRYKLCNPSSKRAC